MKYLIKFTIIICLFFSLTIYSYWNYELSFDNIFVENIDNFENFWLELDRHISNNAYRIDIELRKWLSCNINELLSVKEFKDFKKTIIKKHTNSKFNDLDDLNEKIEDLETEVKTLESEFISLWYNDSINEYEKVRDETISKYKIYLSHINNLNNIEEDLYEYQIALLDNCNEIKNNFLNEELNIKEKIEIIDSNIIELKNNFNNKEEFNNLLKESENILEEISEKWLNDDEFRNLRNKIENIKSEAEKYTKNNKEEKNDEKIAKLSEQKKSKINNIIVVLENKNPKLINDFYKLVVTLKNNYKESSNNFLILEELEKQLNDKIKND